MNPQTRAAVIVSLVLGGAVVGALVGLGVYRAGLDTIDEAPAFTLTSTGYENGTLGNETTFSLDDYRGQTVLLDFMAINCSACRHLEREVLEPLWEEKRNETGFALVSIDTWADPDTGQNFAFGGETSKKLAAFQQEHGHDWRHAIDTDDVWQKYEAVAIPKIAVIGPEGQLVREWTGIPSLSDVRAVVDDSMAGQGASDEVFRFDLPPTMVLFGLALVAGGASFFSPCSVGLIPAYMGFLLQGTEEADPARRTLTTLKAGLLTAGGIVTTYGVLASVLAGLGLLGFNEAMQDAIPLLVPLMAVVLIVAGLLLFFKVSWDWLTRRFTVLDGRRGFYTFGLGYGLAAFGCTGPIFLPILLAGFLAGPVMGIIAFLLYSLAIATFVFIAAALVAGGHQTRLRRLLSHSQAINRISAVLLVGAGIWLLWFEASAGVI